MTIKYNIDKTNLRRTQMPKHVVYFKKPCKKIYFFTIACAKNSTFYAFLGFSNLGP